MKNSDNNDISFSELGIDPEIVDLLNERYKEICYCREHAPLAATIMLGSTLEGLLYGIGKKHPKNFTNKDKKNISEWSLAQLIDVAHKSGFMRLDDKKFVEVLRSFRNYVHPVKQLKEKFYPDQRTVTRCLSSVKDIVDNLIEKNNIKKKLSDAIDWQQHPDASFIALIILIGFWDENNKSDTTIIEKLLGISYDEWQKKAQKILLSENTILSFKNGVWRVNNRVELLQNLGSHIFDNHLDTFKSVVVTILQELDPALDLPNNQRYTANIKGKILKHSPELRQGIAEGLAILGSNLESVNKCSFGKTDEICRLTIREIFDTNNWVIWASLNSLLPSLAEAYPDEFLNTIDATLKLTPCPFDELFAQEGTGIFGRCYISGVLWSLETLAWDGGYFAVACLHLAKLASYDPGGQWANRPFNSLRTILLPWLPQTLASTYNRKILIKSLFNEYPDIAWQLIIELLPDSHQSSSYTHKPKWRNIILDNRNEEVTQGEYLAQVTDYAELAVDIAKNDTTKLAELINYFDRLPATAFDKLVEVLKSVEIINLADEQRQLLWDNLTRFIRKHKKYSSAKWALKDDKIAILDEVANSIAPKKSMNLYKQLFINREHELYEDNNWEEQQKNLNKKRENAIKDICNQDGIDGVIKFIEIVEAPRFIGYALATINNNSIEQKLLPEFLDSTNKKHLEFINAFITKCNQLNGWQWADNLDKSTWTNNQIAQFLAYLPFTQNTWDRASKWLKTQEDKYWLCTTAFPHEDKDGNLTNAIDKLLKYNRPSAAIDCLYRMIYSEKSINVNQCIQALLSLGSINKLDKTIDKYNILELIKFIQKNTSVAEKDILEIEWLYLPLLDYNDEASPKFLENQLANNPKFFLEAIQLCYKSTKPNNTKKIPQATATNAWSLLRNWRTPPGIKADGLFDEQQFTNWLEQTKNICKEAGYIEVALEYIGQVLFYVPKDDNGLWINKTVTQAINQDDAEDLRNGFRTQIYNSRGVYWVDKTGKAEQDIANHWQTKAEELEKQGYFRFANTLKNLAKNYEWGAKRIVDKYADETT